MFHGTDDILERLWITGVSGKFDIGGFSISEPTPTDDQSFDFTVEITDFDGDTDSVSHSAGIDRTGMNNDDQIFIDDVLIF